MEIYLYILKVLLLLLLLPRPPSIHPATLTRVSLYQYNEIVVLHIVHTTRGAIKAAINVIILITHNNALNEYFVLLLAALTPS